MPNNGLTTFQENDKFFIKFFLIDAALNLNSWGVTEMALKANLDTFINKPFVLTPDFSHPSAPEGTSLLIEQENFRVGNISSVGIDDKTKKAFGIAEITDKGAIDVIKSGEVNFVSPSIVFNPQTDMSFEHGFEVITKFEGAHVAAVKDPAYGMLKAQIKGKCSGNGATCEKELAMVQASRNDKMYLKEGELTYVIANQECVSACLRKKKEAGVEINDKQIAICLSECGESEKEANIDPESLDNITKVDLKKCKKKDDTEVCGSNSSNNESNSNSSLMTSEEQKKKEDESAEFVDEEEDKQKSSRKSRKAEEEDEKKEKEAEEEKDEEKKNMEAQLKQASKELKQLKAQYATDKKLPIVNSILDAKVQLNLTSESNREAELEDLVKLDITTLDSLQADFEKLTANQPKTPSYKLVYSQASRGNSSDKPLSYDSIIMRRGL